MWIDAPWSTGHNTFLFNEVQFPDIDDALTRAEELGYRVIVWATEHINDSDDSAQQVGMEPFAQRPLFDAFKDDGYLVTTNDGSPFTFVWGRGHGGFVDFSHAGAVGAWQDLIRPLLQ